MYIYEKKGWPHFTWDEKKIAPLLIQTRHQQGLLIGIMESIGFEQKEEIILQTLTQDVVKSSEIEGEILDQSLVRSSVARHLGIEDGADSIDRNIDGVVEMILDATQKFDQPLTSDRLFGWHACLFPTARNKMRKIKVAAWRTGPVSVVSGKIGDEKIHFEGPPAEQVDHQMEQLIHWLNHETKIDPVLKSAIAHLWFVTIHPFEDGNGRIGRAIADLCLARSEKSSRRYYSLSSQIQTERKDYYHILEKTQKDGLDITPWIEWFLQCMERAIQKALSIFDRVKFKEQIWKSIAQIPINERQHKLINRLLDGFEGKFTTTKWAKIAKCSQDTAYRDILDLIQKGILTKNTEGGKNTSYSLKTKS